MEAPPRAFWAAAFERDGAAPFVEMGQNSEFERFCPIFSLAEFPYLFGDRQALPKTPEKTEMVLRFPLGFA